MGSLGAVLPFLSNARAGISPPTPSSGRWTTSKVALSGNSSRSRTSSGPDNEARADSVPNYQTRISLDCSPLAEGMASKGKLTEREASGPIRSIQLTKGGRKWSKLDRRTAIQSRRRGHNLQTKLFIRTRSPPRLPNILRQIW